jgi:hypothetical protein
MHNTETLILNEDFNLKVEREYNSIIFIIVDKNFNIERHLSTYSSGIWSYPTIIERNDFWALAKQYPTKIKNCVIKKYNSENVTFKRQFSCLKRRINIQITKQLRKLK